MEPLSVLATVAKAVATQAGKALGGAVAQRISGKREQRALADALGRAFAGVRPSLADFDVNEDFWVHEGAAELAEVLVAGGSPSPVRLAEKAIDSLGPARSEDERFDRIAQARPAFKALLDGLAGEVRREPALHAVLGRSDSAVAADSVTRLARHLGAAGAGADDQVHYLRWLIDRNSYLRTAGVVRRTTVRLPLGEVFVGLRACRDRHPGDRARVWFERERERLSAQVDAGLLDRTGFEAALDRLRSEYGRSDGPGTPDQVVPVLDALRDTPQVLVLGDPGSGKTTLLRFLALTHARALLGGEQVHGRDARFPIYVRVGDYARTGYPGVGISEFLAGYLSRSECRTPGLADLVRGQLDAGRCLVLLDGLDEIASAELRRGVVDAVVDFVTAYARPGNRFVVTSRIAGYQAAPLPDPFAGLRLQEMDDATIHRFLDVYCREVERAESPGVSEAVVRKGGAREAEAIRQALTTNAGVRRLAANPLLLTALVLVHRASGRLPHRRVETYIEVCNALGRNWRSAQGVAEADLPDERVLTTWLTDLGAWLHENRSEGTATRLELLAVLGPRWAANQGVAWDPGLLASADPLGSDAGAGVMEFVHKTDQHTGLLVERAPGRYGFAHLTFEEYYAGRALAFRGSALDRVSAIRARLHDPRYEEPIRLALGLIGTDYAEQVQAVVAEAIFPAAASPGPYEDLLGRDFRFMLGVLADDTPLPTATIDAVLGQAIDELLERAGRGRFTAYRQALTRCLASLGGTKAGDRLRSALEQRAGRITHRESLAWSQLSAAAARTGPLHPGTLASLVSIATAAVPLTQAAAIEALVIAGPLPDRVLSVLIDLCTGTRHHPDVRDTARAVLATFGSLPEPLVVKLIALAAPDVEPDVRLLAVTALAAGEALSERVASDLAGMAIADPSSEVRERAVSALVRVPEQTGPVIVALTRIATRSTEGKLQLRALRGLADRGALTEPLIAEVARIATGGGRLLGLHAVGVLADCKVMTASTVDSLVRLASSAEDARVRQEAVEGLIATGVRTGPVVAMLTKKVTGDASREVRVAAASGLAGVGAGSPSVVALLKETITGAAPHLRVVAARGLVALGESIDEAIAALTVVASDAPGPRDRMAATAALGADGILDDAAFTALSRMATGAADPHLRVMAARSLAGGGLLSEPVTKDLMVIATEDGSWANRVAALGVLSSAAPAADLQQAITALFADRGFGIQRAAGATLAELARRHPESASDIAAGLARACTVPAFRVGEAVTGRTGWDYAHEALFTLAENLAIAPHRVSSVLVAAAEGDR